jgi:hypothetical protein
MACGHLEKSTIKGGALRALVIDTARIQEQQEDFKSGCSFSDTGQWEEKE